MRVTLLITTTGFLLAALPAVAQPNPSQFLQGLLSGDQGQDRAVRDAFERGYRQGRQDQAGEDRGRSERRPQRPREEYQEPSRNQGYPPPPPYQR